MTQNAKTIDLPIPLPKMGESVSEATVIEWLKKPGDTIERDELFVLIGTDKVDSELPSSYDGILKEILVQEGEVTEVGSPLCIIEVEERQVKKEDLEKPTESIASSTTEISKTIDIKAYKGSKSFLSPVVRKIATEAGLELNELEKIKGTGENGRIRKKDILNYLQPKKKDEPTSGLINQKMKLEVGAGDTVNQLSRMQKLLATHLQQSFMEIPHVTTFAEVDVTDIVAHREKHKTEFLEKHNTKITYTHYFQYAIIQALKEFPLLNAWMNVDEVIQKQNINLGFAAALENGDLIVPNVKEAQTMDFLQWVKAVNNVAAKAKRSTLTNDDIQKTTFTVSNTGMFGSLAGTPIVSRPQVGVIALGQILSAPGVILENNQEKLAVRKKMMLSISYDHRVINGSYASLFLTKIKEILAQYSAWVKI